MLDLLFLALLPSAAPGTSPTEVPAMITQLDSEAYALREAASKTLACFPRAVIDRDVRLAHRNAVSPEQRERLRQIIHAWECNDKCEAIRIFDETFPRECDVPFLDSAWYDPHDRIYAVARWTSVMRKDLMPWVVEARDEPRFPNVFSKYRVATRAWGIDKLSRGVPLPVVKAVIDWLKEVDYVYLRRNDPKVTPKEQFTEMLFLWSLLKLCQCFERY